MPEICLKMLSGDSIQCTYTTYDNIIDFISNTLKVIKKQIFIFTLDILDKESDFKNIKNIKNIKSIKGKDQANLFIKSIHDLILTPQEIEEYMKLNDMMDQAYEMAKEVKRPSCWKCILWVNRKDKNIWEVICIHSVDDIEYRVSSTTYGGVWWNVNTPTTSLAKKQFEYMLENNQEI